MPPSIEEEEMNRTARGGDTTPTSPHTCDFGCDRWPLHYACRVGNLDQVRYLVDVMHCPVNEPDPHDATPLYLAALTGRKEICRFLLERGARAGGDAARVFYVALTPQLRRLLREWSLSAATRDVFVDGLRQSFNDPTFADCVFIDGPDGSSKPPIYLCRILLHARCPQIHRLLHVVSSTPAPLSSFEKANDDNHLPQVCLDRSSLSRHCAQEDYYDSMVLLLQFIYTASLDVRDIETARRLQELARVVEWSSIYEHLESAFQQYNNTNDRAFRCEITNVASLRLDMRRLARRASTPTTCTSDGEGNDDDNSSKSASLFWNFTDASVQCLDATWQVNRFLLCGQSDYFNRALAGHFREAHESLVNVSRLVPCPETWTLALQWMYADEFLDTPVSSLDVAVQVLDLGLTILCRRLSVYVANCVLLAAVDRNTVFDILYLARTHGFERLEDGCIEFIGNHLEELVHEDNCDGQREQLRQVLAQEAAAIIQKGDIEVVDVPIAAEIRRVIAKVAGNHEEHQRQLDLLHGLVQEALQD